MKRSTMIFATLQMVTTFGFALMAYSADTVTIPVDSPAFVFSPGNWTGDEGRGGKRYRQTWNPGAYFRVTWESETTNVVPALLMEASTYNGSFNPPTLVAPAW